MPAIIIAVVAAMLLSRFTSVGLIFCTGAVPMENLLLSAVVTCAGAECTSTVVLFVLVTEGVKNASTVALLRRGYVQQ